MGFIVPIVNRDIADIRNQFREWYYAKMANDTTQKRMVLVVVSIALLLDNMLYMVIVPIIPKYLRTINAWEFTEVCEWHNTTTNGKMVGKQICKKDYKEEEQLGFLFASKALIQILVNPFSGTLIDRIGYEVPMMIGLIVMFLSTSIFALGQSYGVLFFARSLQGFGSAFADTAGLAMIANRFKEEHERSKALGIALAFISFGCLVAPPFGGIIYNLAGKPVPFLILALVCLADGILVFMIIEPKMHNKTEHGEQVQGTPIWRLFADPYIACCSGALIMANVSLAFLEPTISNWMSDTMHTDAWEAGLIWLPPFFPHVAGVYATVLLMRKYPQQPWLIAAVGLAMEGLSCFIIPFTTNFWVLALPLSSICFGIALVDTSLLPTLGYLVDTRHVSVYGSVYAIADISYSLAYAFGPIIAGEIVKNQSFFVLNLIICLSNLLFAPVLTNLKKFYAYKPFENEMMTFNGDSGYGADNPYQTWDSGTGHKGYGSVTPTAQNGGFYSTSDGQRGYADEEVVGQDGYGYGSGDYVGGFGVDNVNINYKQDFPQPEFPQGEVRGQTLFEQSRKRPKPKSGYKGYNDTDAILRDQEEFDFR